LPKLQLIKPNYLSLLFIMAFVRRFVPNYGKCAVSCRTREFGVDCRWYILCSKRMINCHVHSIPVGYRWCFTFRRMTNCQVHSFNTPLVSKRPKRMFFLKACCSTISCRTREFGVDCRWRVLHSDG